VVFARKKSSPTRKTIRPAGQGELYVVFDDNEQTTGVLKLIDMNRLPAGAGPWDEARVLRQLADDHILPILNADSIAGQPFIVTELAEHGTLANALDATGGLGVGIDEAVAWIRQACVGIQRAHDVSLVHNDVKPANLFLNENRECLVGDFGLASLVPAPPLIGVARGASPETAAPEVAAGWAAGAPPASFQTDVYSLAATAYWLLAGRPGVDLRGIGALQAKMAAAATQARPRLRDIAPHVPASIANVIEKAMSTAPADRYGTVSEFAATLGSRSTKPRRWHRTNEHPGHVGCWRGERVGRATYVLCLERGAKPTACSVTTRHETGAKVHGGSRTDSMRMWARAVRATIDKLS
jgi:serine/threonine-protein kinase